MEDNHLALNPKDCLIFLVVRRFSKRRGFTRQRVIPFDFQHLFNVLPTFGKWL